MQTTVIEAPVELKPAIDSFIKTAREAAKRVSGARTTDSLVLEVEVRAVAGECERAALEYVVQAADADAPSREAAKLAEELGRLPYSRSSFERVGHAVAEHYVTQHADVDEMLSADYEPPATVAALVVSLDRVSVPMEEPRSRPRGRPRKGAAKRPVERNFRMAYCGCVTLLDHEGKPLHKICLVPRVSTLKCASSRFHSSGAPSTTTVTASSATAGLGRRRGHLQELGRVEDETARRSLARKHGWAHRPSTFERPVGRGHGAHAATSTSGGRSGSLISARITPSMFDVVGHFCDQL